MLMHFSKPGSKHEMVLFHPISIHLFCCSYVLLVQCYSVAPRATDVSRLIVLFSEPFWQKLVSYSSL